MLRVYGFPSFNTAKVLYTAEELQLDYKYIFLNPNKGETKSQEHKERHPLGKIPAIEDGDKTLFESNAICRYLAANSSLYPDDKWERAQIDQWIDFFTQHIGRWIGAYYYQTVIKPQFYNKEPLDFILSEAHHFLDQQMPVLDQHLKENDWLANNQYSIADTIAFPNFYISKKTDLDFSKYENVMSWSAQQEEKLSAQKAIKLGLV